MSPKDATFKGRAVVNQKMCIISLIKDFMTVSSSGPMSVPAVVVEGGQIAANGKATSVQRSCESTECLKRPPLSSFYSVLYLI